MINLREIDLQKKTNDLRSKKQLKLSQKFSNDFVLTIIQHMEKTSGEQFNISTTLDLTVSTYHIILRLRRETTKVCHRRNAKRPKSAKLSHFTPETK